MHENNRKLFLDTSQTFGHWKVSLKAHSKPSDLRHFFRKSYSTQL